MNRLTFFSACLLLVAFVLSACGSAPPQVAEQPAPNPTERPTTRPIARPTTRPAARPTAVPPIPTQPPTDTPPAAAPTEQPPAPTTPASELTAVVTNGGNVREQPVKGKPLDQVNAHETVHLLGKNADGTWYLLTTPRNITGWVSKTLLTIEPAAAAAAPVTNPAAAATGSAPAPADEWTTHTVGQSTLALPASWQPLTLSKETLEQAAALLEAGSPAMAQSLHQLVDTGLYKQIQFFAFNRGPGCSCQSVVLASVPRPEAMTVEEVLREVMHRALTGVPGARLVSADERHQVNSLPAGRLVYELSLTVAGRDIAMRGVQWYIVSGTTVYAITVSGIASDELLATADRIGHSLTTYDPAPSGAAQSELRQVTNGGNLRRAPQIDPSNVIGQVCPGDQLALLDGPKPGKWAHVQLVRAAADCDPKRVAVGAEGWVSTSLLGPVQAGGTASLPPSLLITKLTPFTHTRSGIRGLRPDTWTLFETGNGFQVSSSPEAPDGFGGHLIAPADYPAGGAPAAAREMLDLLKRNTADGPAPVIAEETFSPEGNGTLLATVTGVAQASTEPVRMTIYVRTTVTLRGVLVSIAVVPADLFPREEPLVRQMVDSLQLAADA